MKTLVMETTVNTLQYNLIQKDVMKLGKRIFLYVASTYFWSCSISFEDLSSHSDKNQIFEKISLLNNDKLKALYVSSLTSKEKSDYWHLKFEKTLITNTLNEDQIQLINELKGRISKLIFEESKEREIFFNYFLESWIKAALEVFDGRQVYTLVFSSNVNLPIKGIGGHYDDVPIETHSSETTLDHCHCTVNSAYTCGRVVIPWGLEFGTCSLGANVRCINEGERQCGALLDQVCNGNICTW